ncbi:MAG: sigma-54-dependent Fis family transcriptional regulator, partial [Lysobacteraceae bacterium]
IEVGDLSLKAARPGDAAGREPQAAPALVPVAVPEAEAEPVPPATVAAPPPGPAMLGPNGLPSNLPEYLSQVERDIIQRALQQTQFNRTQAAALLGISVRQLRYQMQKLEICAPDDNA